MHHASLNHFFSLLGSKAQLLTWHANYTASELPKGRAGHSVSAVKSVRLIRF